MLIVHGSASPQAGIRTRESWHIAFPGCPHAWPSMPCHVAAPVVEVFLRDVPALAYRCGGSRGIATPFPFGATLSKSPWIGKPWFEMPCKAQSTAIAVAVAMASICNAAGRSKQGFDGREGLVQRCLNLQHTTAGTFGVSGIGFALGEVVRCLKRRSYPHSRAWALFSAHRAPACAAWSATLADPRAACLRPIRSASHAPARCPPCPGCCAPAP